MSKEVAEAYEKAIQQNIKVTYSAVSRVFRFEAENGEITLVGEDRNIIPTETFNPQEYLDGAEYTILGRLVDTPQSIYIIKDGDTVEFDK